MHVNFFYTAGDRPESPSGEAYDSSAISLVGTQLADVEKALVAGTAATANSNLAISNLNLHNQHHERRFSQIADNFDKINESLKSLEIIARANTDAISTLQQEWQAYLRTRPSN